MDGSRRGNFLRKVKALAAIGAHVCSDDGLECCMHRRRWEREGPRALSSADQIERLERFAQECADCTAELGWASSECSESNP